MAIQCVAANDWQFAIGGGGLAGNLSINFAETHTEIGARINELQAHLGVPETDFSPFLPVNPEPSDLVGTDDGTLILTVPAFAFNMIPGMLAVFIVEIDTLGIQTSDCEAWTGTEGAPFFGGEFLYKTVTSAFSGRYGTSLPLSLLTVQGWSRIIDLLHNFLDPGFYPSGSFNALGCFDDTPMDFEYDPANLNISTLMSPPTAEEEADLADFTVYVFLAGPNSGERIMGAATTTDTNADDFGLWLARDGAYHEYAAPVRGLKETTVTVDFAVDETLFDSGGTVPGVFGPADALSFEWKLFHLQQLGSGSEKNQPINFQSVNNAALDAFAYEAEETSTLLFSAPGTGATVTLPYGQSGDDTLISENLHFAVSLRITVNERDWATWAAEQAEIGVDGGKVSILASATATISDATCGYSEEITFGGETQVLPN